MTEIFFSISNNETDTSSKYTMKINKTNALMPTHPAELTDTAKSENNSNKQTIAEIIYSISSNETNVSTRYMMKFNKTHALMSTYLTELITTAKFGDNNNYDLGMIPTTAAALKCVDDYIKHHAINEDKVRQLIKDSDVSYRKWGHLELNERLKYADDYDMIMFNGQNITCGQFFIDVALCAHFLKIEPLITCIAKTIARMVCDISRYYGNIYNNNGTSRENINSIGTIMIGSDITDEKEVPYKLNCYNIDYSKKINELSRTITSDEYTSYMSKLLKKEYTGTSASKMDHISNDLDVTKLKNMANVFLYVQHYDSCHYNPLKMYFPHIFELLITRANIPLEKDLYSYSFTGNYFEFELFCRLDYESFFNKIITLSFYPSRIPGDIQFPPEISRLKNLQFIFVRDVMSDVIPPDGFKIVGCTPYDKSVTQVEMGGGEYYLVKFTYTLIRIK